MSARVESGTVDSDPAPKRYGTVPATAILASRRILAATTDTAVRI